MYACFGTSKAGLPNSTAALEYIRRRQRTNIPIREVSARCEHDELDEELRGEDDKEGQVKRAHCVYVDRNRMDGVSWVDVRTNGWTNASTSW